jgi:hypothetical protein
VIFYRSPSLLQMNFLGDNYLMAVVYRPTWLGRLFKLESYETNYVGDGIVWRDIFPLGERTSPWTEIHLDRIWRRWIAKQ